MTDAATGAVVHGAADSPRSVQGPRAHAISVSTPTSGLGRASAPPAASHHVTGDVTVSGSMMDQGDMDQTATTIPVGTRPRAVSGETRRVPSRVQTTGTSRIGGSPTPGTQFSAVSRLWKKRESSVGTSRRRSPSCALQQATSVMQSSLQDVEQKVANLERQSAQGMESTRRVSEEALTSIHSVRQEAW